MKPPTAQARLILDRYRAAESLGIAEKQRLLDVVQLRAFRGDVPRFDVATTLPVPPSGGLPAQLWATPLGKAALVSALAGATALGGLAIRKASAPPPAPAAFFRGDDASAVTSPPDAPGVPMPQASLVPQGMGSRFAPPRSRAKPSPVDATIDEEVRLLNAAQSALRAGDGAEALRLLNEHATRFPGSKLADARAVARMSALCKMGQVGVARREADRFLAQHPDSPFADRVEKICLSPVHP